MIKTIRVPGQIRRYVLKEMAEPTSVGEKELLAACEEGDRTLKAKGMNTLNTIELNLPNAAIGAALDIARRWLDSDNGNNVMAGKSMLKFELEYEPDDPREIRHAIKLPKSLAGNFMGQYSYDPKTYLGEDDVIRLDLDCMSWTSAGASGRVRAATLGWFLGKMDGLKENPHPATSRAAKKFLDTYTEPYEQTRRLIAGHLEIEDQAPELVDDEPEVEDQEPETPPREWQKYRMSRFVNWSGRRTFFYYGGPAKKAVNENGPLVYVSWKESYEGTNLLRHAETGEVVDTVHSMANVWGIPAEEPEGFTDPKAEPEPAAEVKGPLLDLIAETAPPKGGYEVPANFLELAEEGNTDQAKAYWKRRCEEYRRTGK
jgi:hypothetical protein